MVHARTLHTDIGGDFAKAKTVVARCPNSPLGSIHDFGRLLWNLSGCRSHHVLWKKSLALTAQAAAKAMKAQGRGGAIVHTGSLWAIQAIGATPSSAYSAANAGVHALVRNLAIELAPDRIRINAVAPAVVETPVYGTFLSPEKVKEILPTFNAFHPLGRNGQPADIAEAILFLASEQASWITGTVLPVDGGVTAGRQ